MEIPAVIRSRKTVSPLLQIIRVAPRDRGTPLPLFEAGQALELVASGVPLVRKIYGPGGAERYVYERDASGAVAVGRMALWYSIASPPGEAATSGEVEFFVSLHSVEGDPTRFLLDGGEPLCYGDRPRGDFTIAARARGARQIVFAATGTGIAPVVSMIRHLHAEAVAGRRIGAALTLIHGHRTLAELGYAGELRDIEQAAALDFVYLPMLTRIPHGGPAAETGYGRVTDAVRAMLGQGEGVRFPGERTAAELRPRLRGDATVILACGGPAMLREMAAIAAGAGLRFEQEGW